MILYYNGTDMTGYADIVSAIHKDSSSRCDCLDMTLDHADCWYRWKPQQDDSVELVHEGYSTGKLFLSAVAPENGKYRIIATSMKSSARKRMWASYAGITLHDLFALCGAECGMESKLFGMNGGFSYPYMLRRNESCAAFLQRIAFWEGGVLKVYSGRFTAIDILSAQALAANAVIDLRSDQDGFRYQRMEDQCFSSLTLKTPYAEVSAHDERAAFGCSMTMTDIPAANEVIAGRWVRGILLGHNRKMEEVQLSCELNQSFTAMARIDLAGTTDASGRWLVDEVEHDFVNKRSRAKMFRCLDSVH